MAGTRKTVTLNLGRAGGSPKNVAGTLKLKLRKGPLSTAFLQGFERLIKQHKIRRDFDVALAVRPKKDIEPTSLMPNFVMSAKDLGPHRDSLPGGLADKSKPSDFDPRELEMGIEVEMEHTKSAKIAREIAMDHLKEDPRYYTKLKKIHQEAKGKRPAIALAVDASRHAEKHDTPEAHGDAQRHWKGMEANATADWLRSHYKAIGKHHFDRSYGKKSELPFRLGEPYKKESIDWSCGSIFGEEIAAWGVLDERRRGRFRKSRKAKDMEEYGSPGAVAGKGGISDPGHHPPTLGWPSR